MIDVTEAKFRIAKRMIRGAARVLGVDMASFDAEIARVESLSPDDLQADTDRKLAEIQKMRKGGK